MNSNVFPQWAKKARLNGLEQEGKKKKKKRRDIWCAIDLTFPRFPSHFFLFRSAGVLADNRPAQRGRMDDLTSQAHDEKMGKVRGRYFVIVIGLFFS